MRRRRKYYTFRVRAKTMTTLHVCCLIAKQSVDHTADKQTKDQNSDDHTRIGITMYERYIANITRF